MYYFAILYEKYNKISWRKKKYKINSNGIVYNFIDVLLKSLYWIICKLVQAS